MKTLALEPKPRSLALKVIWPVTHQCHLVLLKEKNIKYRKHMNGDKDDIALQYQKMLLKASGIHEKFKEQAYKLRFVFSEYRI